MRRGFHTLKGSGRMVGLTELGEIAYAVEKVHNRLLEDELPVTPAVLGFIDVAQTSFRVWVDTLRRKHRRDAGYDRAARGDHHGGGRVPRRRLRRHRARPRRRHPPPWRRRARHPRR